MNRLKNWSNKYEVDVVAEYTLRYCLTLPTKWEEKVNFHEDLIRLKRRNVDPIDAVDILIKKGTLKCHS